MSLRGQFANWPRQSVTPVLFSSLVPRPLERKSKGGTRRFPLWPKGGILKGTVSEQVPLSGFFPRFLWRQRNRAAGGTLRLLPRKEIKDGGCGLPRRRKRLLAMTKLVCCCLRFNAEAQQKLSYRKSITSYRSGVTKPVIARPRVPIEAAASMGKGGAIERLQASAALAQTAEAQPARFATTRPRQSVSPSFCNGGCLIFYAGFPKKYPPGRLAGLVPGGYTGCVTALMVVHPSCLLKENTPAGSQTGRGFSRIQAVYRRAFDSKSMPRSGIPQLLTPRSSLLIHRAPISFTARAARPPQSGERGLSGS